MHHYHVTDDLLHPIATLSVGDGWVLCTWMHWTGNGRLVPLAGCTRDGLDGFTEAPRPAWWFLPGERAAIQDWVDGWENVQ